MSEIKLRSPVLHTPSLTRYVLPRRRFILLLEKLNIEPTRFPFDNWYYFLSLEDWNKILWDLTFKSNLYKAEIFDCEDLALKGQVVCAERYGVNAFRCCFGKSPKGYHAFNILFYGDEYNLEGAMLFEPNDGYAHSGEMFNIGEYGYKPELVLI